MASKSIISQQLFTAADAGINGNGRYCLFQSPTYDAPKDYAAADVGLELVVTYLENLPDPEVQVAKYNLSCILETQDEAGNWHPFHNQFEPYVKAERGNQFILRMDPSKIILDPSVPVDMWDGTQVIARICDAQGRLPDDFRLCIFVNEFGYQVDPADGLNKPTVSSFQQVKVTASFRTYVI